METILLKDPEVFPSDDVLKYVLGDIYPVYKELMDTIANDPFSLSAGWRFYNDGKTWLCKVVNKKKTVFWLSVWDGCFKTGFYFTEKSSTGITDLPISKEIMETFLSAKPAGKLIPLSINVSSAEQLPDIMQIIEYKMKQK